MDSDETRQGVVLVEVSVQMIHDFHGGLDVPLDQFLKHGKPGPSTAFDLAALLEERFGFALGFGHIVSP